MRLPKIFVLAILVIAVSCGAVVKSRSDLLRDAEVFIERENYERAIETLKPILVADIADPDANYLMGYVMEEIGDFHKAIEYYVTATQNSEEFYDVYFNIAYLSFETENNEQARDYYLKYNEVFPGDAGSYYNLGVVYNALGEWKKCIRAYEDAVLIDSGYYNALYNLAVAYYDISEYETSIHYWNRVLEVDASEADAYYGIGLNYYDLSDYYAAIDAFTGGVDYVPEEGRFYYQLGRCYYSIFKYDEAIAAFSSALKYDYFPDEDVYYLGYIFADIHDYEQAIYYLDKTTEFTKELPRPHIEKALIYRRLGQYGHALDSLFMANRLEFEDMPFLWNLLGQTYLDLGQFDMAAKYLRKSINEETDYVEAHYHLAITMENIDKEKAVKQWERYIGLADGVPGEKYSVEEAHRRLKTLRNDKHTLPK